MRIRYINQLRGVLKLQLSSNVSEKQMLKIVSELAKYLLGMNCSVEVVATRINFIQYTTEVQQKEVIIEGVWSGALEIQQVNKGLSIFYELNIDSMYGFCFSGIVVLGCWGLMFTDQIVGSSLLLATGVFGLLYVQRMKWIFRRKLLDLFKGKDYSAE